VTDEPPRRSGELSRGREHAAILTRFIELWQEHYDKLSDEDRVLMPLVLVYFLAETD